MSLVERLAGIVGDAYVTTDPDVLRGRATDHTGRWEGKARALVRPSGTEEVAAVLAACRAEGVAVTVQGGRTSLVAGTVPEHDDVLLSTERLDWIGAADPAGGRLRAGAGARLAEVQAVAAAAGLEFGVDIGARDTATLGGMAATNAGGLHTIRYGSMSAQVLGMEIVLPDGTVVRRMSEVRADNTGYDMLGIWSGSEGTLGVITELEVALHPRPRRLVAALGGFTTLPGLLEAGAPLRHLEGVRALELLDGRGVDLAERHLNLPRPTTDRHPWYLLAEVGADHDPLDALASALAETAVAGEPAVAIGPDRAGLWRLRDGFSEVVGLFGAPSKFDVALPLGALAPFAEAAESLVSERAPDATVVLFGHVGEGNLHLNVLNCPESAGLDKPMMTLISDHGGNVSSEHGVGRAKRDYLGLSRTPADINTMWHLKRTYDPPILLNPAVLFPRTLTGPTRTP